jgi:pimeloyl-ACP methyl ester carboxylesterase
MRTDGGDRFVRLLTLTLTALVSSHASPHTGFVPFLSVNHRTTCAPCLGLSPVSIYRPSKPDPNSISLTNNYYPDFFGRGYSDAPTDLPYDLRLYTTQILLALSSSPLPWTGNAAFHLLGYSLGGAIAAAFAAYSPHLLRSLTLLCPGGLIRSKHLSVRGRLLYSEGLFPEWVLQGLVRERLRPQLVDAVRCGSGSSAGSAVGRLGVPSVDRPEIEVVQDINLELDLDPDVRGSSVFDNAELSSSRPGVTVADVIAWQLKSHPGFIPAYMSTIRHAPIYDQGDKDWKVLAEELRRRRPIASQLVPNPGESVPPGLSGGKILLILGESDPVIVKDEFVEDAKAVLGEDAVMVSIVAGGHEIAITGSSEVANAVLASLPFTG